MNEVTPEDQAKLKDMFEKLEYFLRKYEGYGFAVSTLVFYNGTKVDMQSRLQLTKMIAVPQSPIVAP